MEGVLGVQEGEVDGCVRHTGCCLLISCLLYIRSRGNFFKWGRCRQTCVAHTLKLDFHNLFFSLLLLLRLVTSGVIALLASTLFLFLLLFIFSFSFSFFFI